MKYRIKNSLIAAMMAFGLYGVSFSSAYAVTLADTVQDAVHYHPALKAQDAARDIGEQDIVEARSAFYPTLSTSAQFGRVSRNNETTRRRTTDEGGVESYTGEGFIALNQPLYSGRTTLNRYEAAKLYGQARDFEYSAGMVDVIRQAVVAHIEVARLRMVVQETEDFLTSVADYRDRMEMMVEEGALGHSELLQAEELIMLSRSALLERQEQQYLAESRYEEVVGRMPESDLEISMSWAEPLMPSDLETALMSARQTHPFLKSSNMTVDAMKREIQAEKGTIVPRLDAELSYRQGDQDDRMGGETEDAQAMLNLSWDFSLGGAYSARVNRSRQMREQMLAEHDQRLNTIEHDIKQRFTELTSADKQLEILIQREQANQDIFNAYQDEYESGARSIFDIMNAQNRVFDSKVGLINGYFKHQRATYDLLGATGQIDEAFGHTNASMADQ